jgi:hypothetical protein
MDQETLRTIRALSHHRAVNHYYKICYALLRHLEEFIGAAIGELLLRCASSSIEGCYDAAARIAARVKKEVQRFKKQQVDAVTAWRSLTSSERYSALAN